MMNEILSNTETGRVIIDRVIHRKDLAGDCMVASGNQGTVNGGV